MMASVGVLHAPGTNRDGETARAIALAGGRPEIVSIGTSLDRFAALVLPGGFSYGDALGAGARLALEAGEALVAFAATGRPVLGICNGFQALVRAGLLPGPVASQRTVSLVENERARFECRWVHLAVQSGAAANIAAELPAVISCPVAHGEGRIAVSDDVVPDPETILFRYVQEDGRPANGAYPDNPNGSLADIAGLCNAAGNVWGLMPHPEDHLNLLADPFGRPNREGLGLFKALVRRAA